MSLNFQDKNSAKTGCRKIMQINLELTSTLHESIFPIYKYNFFSISQNVQHAIQFLKKNLEFSGSYFKVQASKGQTLWF